MKGALNPAQRLRALVCTALVLLSLPGWAADTVPEPLVFPAVTGAEPGSTVTSAPQTLGGIDTSVPISVTGGTYNINGGAFVSSSGRVVNGDVVRVRTIASTAFYTSVSARLRVGSPSSSSTFKVTTRKADTTPDAFTFAARTEAGLGSTQDSEPATITGLEAPAAISVSSGGFYSVNGGAFTADAGTVPNNAQVRARGTASSTVNSSTSVTVKIGGISSRFRITTVMTADTTPDAFAFAPLTEVATSSVQTSEPITVGGINTASRISVSGGSYSIDGGAFVDTAGTVNAGQVVRVRQTAAATAVTTTTANLTIGGVSSGFSVTTALPVVSIDDVSVAEGNSGTVIARFTFRLSAAAGQTVSVRFATVAGSATAASDFVHRTGTTTFAAGETSKTQPFTVNGDLAFEADETFFVDLSSANGVTIGRPRGTATIVNDDAAPDTTPDPFTFAPTDDAPLGTLQTSEPVTITGLTAASPVSISGGYYSIDGQAFTAADGRIGNGSTVAVQVLSAYGYAEARTAVLTIGGVAGRYAVTTEAVATDRMPDPFRFTPVDAASPGSVVVSETVTITGINVAVPITVTGAGGTYRINDGAFTDAAGSVVNGDRVTVAISASEELGMTRVATLAIGDGSADFSVTTEAASTMDQDPEPFSFAPVVNAEPGSVQTSAPAMMAGVSAATPISVSGGRYSVNGAAFTTAVGAVSNDDSVIVEATASGEFATKTEAVLTVGSYSTAFAVSTRAADGTPDAFAFPTVVDATPGSLRLSEAVVISGIDVPVAVSIVGGEYRIGSGAFTTAPGTVRNGDSLQLRVAASSRYGTTTAATVTVGGVDAVFDVTTANADVTADAFSFRSVSGAFPLLATVSEAVTVSGINAPVTASVSGGEYSVNGGPFMTASGPVSHGDRVRLLVIPGANRGDVATATLQLGTVSGSFTVTADAPADDFPDIFEFRSTTAARSTVTRSEISDVRGINTGTAISVSGGSYRINGGAFTTAAGTVRGGDQVQLQATSAASYGGETRVTLTIGSRSTTWSLKTENDPSAPQPFTLVNASMFASGEVLPRSVQTSEAVIVRTPTSPLAISITGGRYSRNSGPFTTDSGSVADGDSVVVQMTAASQNATAATATLRIGSLSASMSVTTTIDAVAATPTSATDCTSHIYRSAEPVPLRIFVCRPAGWQQGDRRSALMHWFGGGFVTGTVDGALGEARYWARTQGMVGIAADYRVNDRFGTYCQVAADDGRAALRWVQANAAELGIDPARIALSGSSAGGGVAFFAGLRDAPVTGTAADNPLQRPAAIIARAGTPDITTESHIQPYRNADIFANLGSVISPSVNLDAAYPPVLIFHGDRDSTVAPTPSVHFCSSLTRLGIRCEFRSKAGVGHDLSLSPGGLDAIRDEARVFLTEQGLLPALP